MTWQALYEACTVREREEMVILMLQTIENRKEESIEVFKRDPGLLAALSVAELRELSGRVAEEAHQKIISIHPEIADLLISFECLNSFSMSKKETINYNELADVIGSLKEVWGVSVETTKGRPA